MKSKFTTLKALICILFILLISSLTNLQAQDYLINYAGAGASTDVDSVIIENLMQGTTMKMKGSETLRLTVVTGIESMNEEESGTVCFYPNPMKDQAKMQFILPERGETMITLYDISGRKISQSNDFLERGRHVYIIRGIKGGIYFGKVTSGRYSCSGRLINSGSSGGIPEIAYEHTLSIKAKPEGIKGQAVEKMMQYFTGDRLKMKGISGIYSTVLTIVPTSDKTVTFNFHACTDADGNHYPVVIIGTGKGANGEPDPENKSGDIVAMGSNLIAMTFDNGTAVNHADNQDIWSNYKAYCYYNNNSAYAGNYGLLYNQQAALYGRLCPVGWKIPSEIAWNNLINGLGGEGSAGGPLKETGTIFWTTQSSGTTNSTGFSGRAGGRRGGGQFWDLGIRGYWWASTSYTGYIFYVEISKDSDGAKVYRTYGVDPGFSVRCFMK